MSKRDLSDKPYLKISEAAKALGVSIDTLRRWEIVGKIKPIRTPGGTRVYSPELLREINPALQIGQSAYNKGLVTTEQLLKKSDQQIPYSSIDEIIDKAKGEQIQSNIHSVNLDQIRHKSNYTYSYIFLLIIAISAILTSTISLSYLFLPNQTKQFFSPSSQPIQGIAARLLSPFDYLSKKGLEKFFPDKAKYLGFTKTPLSLDPNVLAISTLANEGRFLEVNADTVITGNLAVEGEGIFNENLTAPNILYGIVEGTNITITGDPQNPTISTAVNETLATVTARGSITTTGITLGNLLNMGQLSTEPTSASNGSTYYNTTSNKIRCYQNGGWKDCDTNTGGSGDITAVNTGNGLSGGASSGDVTIDLDVTTTSTTTTTAANSGLETASAGLSLLRGCSDTQILKWDSIDVRWECASDTGGSSSFTLAGDSGTSQTISSSDTLTVAGGTNGIDTVAGATDTITLNFDATEVGTTTWGSGSQIVWTFDAGATDPTLTFGSNQITIGSAATLSATAVTTFNCTDCIDFDDMEDTLDLDANLTLNQTTSTWAQSFTGTTTAGFSYTANSLTSGDASDISSSATAFTGNLLDVTLSGSNASNTGSLVRITSSGTLSATTALMVTNLGGASSTSFRVNDGTGDTDTTPFIIDASGNVGIGSTTAATNLEVAGAMRLSTTTADTFTTPQSSSVNTKINVPLYNPGAFSQIVAMGVPSTADSTSRVLSLFDARTVAHQPTLGVFSVDENDLIGFSWEGTSSTAYLKTLTNVIGFRVGTTDYLSITSATGVTVAAGIDLTLTSGTGRYVQTFTGTTTNPHSISATAITTGNVLDLSSTSTAATSSDLIQGDHTATYTAATTVSGNLLDLSRALTINAGATTLTVSGAVATISDNCTVTAGTCTHSGNVLSLTQNYSTTTGSILSLTPPSTTNAGGTLEGIDIGNITTSNGTDIAVQIGSGWDSDIAFVDSSVILDGPASSSITLQDFTTLTASSLSTFTTAATLGMTSTTSLNCTDCIDGDDLADAIALDANTSITQDAAETFTITNSSSGNTIINLASTGDFVVQDGGVTALTVADDSSFTYALPAGTVDFTVSGLDADSTITFSGLNSCDTIDTTSAGVLVCGTDAGGTTLAWSALTDPTANLSLAHAAFTTTFGWTSTGALDPWTVNFNNNSTTATTQRAMIINNAAVGTFTDLTTEALLVLNQADTTVTSNTAVTDALLITNTGGSTLTNAITVGSGTQAIGTALNIASTGVTTDISLQNGETISNDTDGTIAINPTTFTLTGTTTLTASSLATFTTAATLGMASTTTLNCGDCIDFDDMEDTLDLDAALTLNQTTSTWTQSFTGTTTTGFTYNANSLTTGTGILISGDTLTTGRIVDLDHTNTYTATTTVSGNDLRIVRSLTFDDSTAGAITGTVSGAVMTISDNCAVGTADVCTHTGGLLSLTQSFASSTGTVLALSNAGTGMTISVTDDDAIGLGTAAGRIVFDDQATDEIELLSANIVLTAGNDIRPAANSATAINIANAAGTDFVTFDSTNLNVRMGTSLGSNENALLTLTPASRTDTAETLVFFSNSANFTLTIDTALTNQRFNQFTAPTIAAGAATDVTNAATVYISNAPIASVVTITNNYALWVDDGAARFDGPVALGAQGTLTANSTTPSVSAGSHFITANTVGTLISNFTSGHTGQIIAIEVNDANTDFDCTASSLNCGTADITVIETGDTIYFIRDATIWNMIGWVDDDASYNAAGGADIAELFVSSETLEAGDLVSIDPTQPIRIHRSKSVYDQKSVGIISTNPGMILKDGPATENAYPVALLGRVPVKVSIENGPITVGDYLTSSSTPGVAMKATRPGPVVGKALEAFPVNTSEVGSDSSEVKSGKIMVFVNVSYADPNQALANLLLDQNGNLIVSKVSTTSLNLGAINQYVDTNILGANTNSLSSTIQQLAADNIYVKQTAVDIASKLQIIDDKLASLEGSVATQSAQLANVESSVKSQESRLEELQKNLSFWLDRSHEQATDSGVVNTPQNDIAGLNLTPPEELLATGSATLADLKVTNTLRSDTLITALDATISGVFKALGNSFLGNTTIAGDLVVDGTFSISQGSHINALPTLYIQSNPLAEVVDFFNGKVTIDKDGTLKANTVVADQIKVTSEQSAGKGTIKAGQTDTIIENSLVKQDSVILVTANSPLSQTLAVADKVNGGFLVKIANPGSFDINFDYLIIGQEQKLSQSSGGSI